MQKRILLILSIPFFLNSCFKDAPEPDEYNNFFDLNHKTGIWFQEIAVDSFLYGGGLYYHNLYFNLTSPELQKSAGKYRLMIKRVWKNDFDYIYDDNSSGFEILVKPADKVGGKFTFDLGVKSTSTGDIIRIYKHVSQW